MSKRRFGWSVEYLRFLAKSIVREPVHVVRRLWSWQIYAFAPGRTRPVRPSRILQCSDVDEAVAAFQRDGFVVLSDGLLLEDAAKLHEVVKSKADEIVRQDAEGLIPVESLHGPRRYSWGEYGHSTEWEYLGENARVLAILRGIWQGRGFRAVAAGGDFVLPGGDWQPLHNDLAWNGAGDKVPQQLVINYYVSDVVPASGPMRAVPGTARFPVPPHRVIGKNEPSWMKQSLITGKPGYAVIRDPRVWHGGTPNTSDAPRYMPNIEYVVNGAATDELDSTATVDQLSQGRWIAEFTNP